MMPVIRLKIALFCVLLIVASAITMMLLHSASDEQIGTLALLRLPIYSGLSSLIGASFVILIFDLFIRRPLVEADKKSLHNALRKTIQSIQGLGESGVVAVHLKMQNSALNESAKDGKELVVLNTYAPNIHELRDGIIDVLQRKGKVRVLLSDPESPFVDVRWPELHDSKEDFVAGIAHNVSRLKTFFEDSGKKGSIEIRYNLRAPGVSIYACGSVAWIGSFLAKRDAVNSPHFSISKDSQIWLEYERHFENLWERANIAWESSCGRNT